MTITITETQEKEVELTLPAYFEYNGNYFKIVSKNEVHEISMSEGTILWINWNHVYSSAADAIQKGEKISESDYQEALVRLKEQASKIN